jgi:hypothetical protein
MKAQIIKVIAVTRGEEREYFTTDGIMIGRQVGGRIEDVEDRKPTKKVKGGIVKSLTPKEAAEVKKRQTEKELTLEERLKYEKKNT